MEKSYNIITSTNDIDIAADQRLLIPYIRFNKIGFINKFLDEVIPARYDTYRGECKIDSDWLAVGENYVFYYGEKEMSKPYFYTHWGIINARGEQVCSCQYRDIYISNDVNRIVVENDDRKWAVIDNNLKEIVPFGKYSKIGNFVKGFARIILNGEMGHTKYGIIDMNGNEIISPEIDNIWPLDNQYDTIVIEIDGRRELLSFKILIAIQNEITRNGHITTSFKQHLEYYLGMQQQFGMPAETINL